MLITLALALNLHGISIKDVKHHIKEARIAGTADTPQRNLFMSEGNMPMGNEYTEQLQTTSSNVNSMLSHSRRNGEMKEVGNWFSDIDERLDDFRDAVNRKLNELHMALQRPKPMFMPPAPQRQLPVEKEEEAEPLENEGEGASEEELRKMLKMMKMKHI